MKLIHTADLHIGSQLNMLDKEMRKKRRNEILLNFTRLVDYAASNDVTAVLIAGDLFDTAVVGKVAVGSVCAVIAANPDISFYYLRGNHDSAGAFTDSDNAPDNLFVFGNDWTKYCLNEYSRGNIDLYGAEMNETDAGTLAESFMADPSHINIVMLHGQNIGYEGRDKVCAVPINSLKDKGIDYLALGHVHKFSDFIKLDARGTYCYPGCLEGRGFDECGEHGFVLLSIDEVSGEIDKEFIPFALRHFHEVTVDVTGADNNSEVISATQSAMASLGIKSDDFVKIVFEGAVPVDSGVVLDDEGIDYIVSSFAGDYMYVKGKSHVSVKVDPMQFAGDKSLKGEFVRRVLADDSISEAEKGQIVALGIKLLKGEKTGV